MLDLLLATQRLRCVNDRRKSCFAAQLNICYGSTLVYQFLEVMLTTDALICRRYVAVLRLRPVARARARHECGDKRAGRVPGPGDGWAKQASRSHSTTGLTRGLVHHGV